MSAVVILRDRQRRQYAKTLVDLAPPGHIVTIKAPTRTLEQNSKFWSMLADMCRHFAAQGKPYTADQMKEAVMRAAGWDIQYVEGLDGEPFPAGYRSSKLSVAQMGKLMDWMEAYGAEHGVVFMERERAT